MKTIRRLVVSLDGTWNNRDDSTNVLYSHSLAFECQEKEWNGNKVTQQRYYQEGVGTGPLDRITGGGFGFGLDDHVREAYDWLVQNFEDGNGTKENPPDEIYVFGFSRGAYTARSLVGFISMCGLLRRGAPLTVSQLWENYCILGLAREERSGGIMGKVFGRPTPKFRRITDLMWDPWYVHSSAAVPQGQVPGQRQDVKLTPTEELLVRWSRRVKITYLGVYDTVGAVGWDALAIPGLRSKLAVQHNMRPSTIIQKCRHALAIDEHRSSFEHTPFVAYIGEKTSAGEMERSGDSKSVPMGNLKMHSTDWQQVKETWERKIQQRWFVGAHSNIGGGYADNRLAQRPLEWILEGARAEGLICEKLPAISPVTRSLAKPRDSFAEFAAPLWTMAFRAKRNYRIIDPRPELRANRDEAKNKGEVHAGFSLVNINETVDESALDYWQGSATAPPNLIECAPRLKDSYPARANELDGLVKKPSANVWPGEGYRPQLALVLWATLAAAGLAVTDGLFCAWPSSPPVWVLCFLALLFPLVDWAESSTNSFLSQHGLIAWRRSLIDSIYWTRALGVVLFAFGLLGTALKFWSTGWHTSSFANAAESVRSFGLQWGAVALCAAVSMLLANAFNKSLSPRAGSKLLAAFMGPLIVVSIIALVVFVAHGLGHVATAALGLSQTEAVASTFTDPVRTAGLLLLLQLAFAYFMRAFVWVGEPMAKANLGGLTPLQWNLTPEGVKKCLDRWCRMLGDHHDENASECEMTGIVRQALWRDVFGFIPVYLLVLLFGLWFGAKQLEWRDWWQPFEYLWFVIPLTAAIADYVENLCHFYFLAVHQKRAKLELKQAEVTSGGHGEITRNEGMPNGVLTFVALVATVVKTIAFIVGIVTVLLAILCASGRIAWNPKEYGWRGLIGLLITTVTILSITGLTIWGWIYKILNRAELKKLTAAHR